jgi:F420-dependent methylenetetrahydromethanopterin dehydrogenase
VVVVKNGVKMSIEPEALFPESARNPTNALVVVVTPEPILPIATEAMKSAEKALLIVNDVPLVR